MIECIYPFNAWVLTPSYEPKEVTLYYQYWKDRNIVWHVAAKEKLYQDKELFPTREEAIKAGYAALDKQEKAYNSRVAKLLKKRATLHKASLATT